MGKLRFGAAFPISEESKKTERSTKLSGIRHSGQSEKADARGQNGTKELETTIGIVGTEAKIN